MGRQPRPSHGEIAVEDAKHAHQVHGAIGHVDGDQFQGGVQSVLPDLLDSGAVGAQTAADDDRGLVEPHGIRALEGRPPRQAAQNWHTKIRKAALNLTLLAGPDGGGRPRQNGALMSHEEEIGAEHLVRAGPLCRVDVVHDHAVGAIGLGHGVVLGLRLAEVDRRQHLHRVVVVQRGSQLIARTMQ